RGGPGRLRAQAVRHGRVAGPAPRRHPPRLPGPGRAGREDGGLDGRAGGQAGHPRRRQRRAADPHGVAVAGGPGAQPWPPRLPAAAAQGGVGAGLRDREQLPAGLRGAAAPQAGARAVPPALPAHRVRHGLPLRPLGWVSAERLAGGQPGNDHSALTSVMARGSISGAAALSVTAAFQPPGLSRLLSLLMVIRCLTECSPLVLALNAASRPAASSCGWVSDESSDVLLAPMRKVPLSVRLFPQAVGRPAEASIASST